MRKFIIAAVLVSLTAVPAFAAKYDRGAEATASMILSGTGAVDTEAIIPARHTGIVVRAGPSRKAFLQVARR